VDNNLLFAQAYDQGILPPQYIFLTLGWYGNEWWNGNFKGLPCTAEHREKVLPFSLVLLNTRFLNKVEDAGLETDTGLVSS
jgi:hypothetical protein